VQTAHQLFVGFKTLSKLKLE